MKKLQQYLPFTVLKRIEIQDGDACTIWVATTPTACGIETGTFYRSLFKNFSVATVLTAYGMRRRVRDSRGAKRR